MREKVLWTINISLVLVAVFLALHLFEVSLPTLGMAQDWLDESDPICVASFGDHNSPIDMGSCCYGLQMQLSCDSWSSPIIVDRNILMVDKKCFTGENTIVYFVNMKAFNYCKKEGYLIK